MARRQYRGNSVQTSLAAAGCTSADTTLTLVDGSSFPTGTSPFVVTLELGLAGEEKILAGARTGNTLSSVTRGFDGTAAAAHAAGATARHTISAVDMDEANGHVNTASAVHGLTSAVVGVDDVQTLTNKTLTAAANPAIALTQAQTHGTPDTDTAAASLHHTLGASATQAAAGNHTHAAGLNTIKFGQGSITTTGSGTYTQAVTFATAFATTPRVVASSGDANTNGTIVGIVCLAQSTTGFTASATQNVGTPKTILFDWIAVA